MTSVYCFAATPSRLPALVRLARAANHSVVTGEGLTDEQRAATVTLTAMQGGELWLLPADPATQWACPDAAPEIRGLAAVASPTAPQHVLMFGWDEGEQRPVQLARLSVTSKKSLSKLIS
jgi:hypothetical protein